jgi:hypothetical protein
MSGITDDTEWVNVDNWSVEPIAMMGAAACPGVVLTMEMIHNRRRLINVHYIQPPGRGNCLYAVKFTAFLLRHVPHSWMQETECGWSSMRPM